MIDLTGVQHHPAITEIVDLLCMKTENTDKGFYRTEVAYFLGKVASNMRATIVTKDRGEIPVNIYALALAKSGFGKGHSVNIIEERLLEGYRRRFVEETFPTIANMNMDLIADERHMKSGKIFEEERDDVEKEFRESGTFPYTFDSGTVPAVKQLRHKLLLADCGAINLQIDEIGSNIFDSVELLNAYLELYDQGKIKQKLTKNTAENIRFEEIEGKTPTNMLLFGTPSKLLDGGKTEDFFYSMLETGYARRCLFGWADSSRSDDERTPEEIYNNLINPQNLQIEDKWYNLFYELAHPSLHGWKMEVEDDVGIALVAYRMDCEKRAESLADHEEVKKAELNHRYFKALKLAGAYSFIDRDYKISMDNLLSAILLVEESGESFHKILNREKSYMKLARFIADHKGIDLTHADLYEALPFYKSGQAARNEQMMMAMAWGYGENIIIKKRFVNGIELFQGETLEETDLNRILVSYSTDMAYDYHYDEAPFDKLDILFQNQGLHWTNHRFVNEHRKEENAIPGFNLLVLDVDEGVSLEMVHELFKEYKFATYTTKRHTEENNRFRLVFPMNYFLELDREEYKQFMQSVQDWLPFETDESGFHRSKKWESHGGGEFYINNGEDTVLLDITQFIPDTSKNQQFKDGINEIQSMDNLERWFAAKISVGNRNNNLFKYGALLMDSGMSFADVNKSVIEFNAKLNNPLSDEELDATILKSLSQKYVNQ